MGAHFLVLLLFFQLGVMPMALVGVASVALYLCAFLLLARGRFRTAFWIAVFELSLHGILATLLVGPQFGFQYYPLLVLILLFIQPFYSTAQSVFFSGTTLASAGLITGYALYHPPLYAVSSGWSEVMIVTMMMLWPIFVLVMVLPFIRASAEAEEALEAAFAESERLLLNVLPQPIAERLKASPGMIADEHDNVAVLFVDIVGFTAMSDRLSPGQIVQLMNQIFSAVDALVEKFGAEKIKTIGDAYMVAVGLPTPCADPDETIAELALEILAAFDAFLEPGTNRPVEARIGIHSGRVVAGVIGNRKFAYDIWGDTVNTAARLESAGVPGKIQLTEEMAARLAERFFVTPRGEITVKGKGQVAVCFLDGLRA